MLGKVCWAVAAAASVCLSWPVLAQPATAESDQPCVAVFNPPAYPQLNRFVPSVGGPDARSKVRGVVVRSILWRPGESIKVCFRSGTHKARARVARYAGEWMQHANVVLDFGDQNEPRTCKGDSHEDIKIDFVNAGPGSGYWSSLGTISRKVEHSLNLSFLGQDDLPRNYAGQSMPDMEARRLVLHEFGHALGLFHEHQSPNAGCAAEYYEEAVFAFGALRGWSQEQSIRNFQQLANVPELNATAVDRKSIMHYSLPPWLFKGGDKSPCVVAPNFELSDGDKEFIKKVYPKVTDAPVVASGPTMSTTRSAKGGTASAAQAKLVEEYRNALQEAGVESGRMEALIKEFQASLAAK